MDLLTDVLQLAGVRCRLVDLRQLADDAALRFPCDRSMGLHVVTQGRVYIHVDGLETPLVLAAGDIAVMARGSHHVLSTRATLDGAQLQTVWAPCGEPRPAGAGTEVISGGYQMWNTPVHPFFAEMPGWFMLRADSVPKLGPLALSLGLLEQEARQRELGAETVVHGLLDVIFTFLLREIVARQGGAGWSRAVRDPHVRQVVALMHADCARPWTLEELAARSGLSRTMLAARFRTAMGDTPLAYLRTVRMQKAMRLLSESSENLDHVALEVGYQDAFSFSKVFKRTVGVSPKEFRRRDAERTTAPGQAPALPPAPP
ncbi:MAG TPA: AraC family transcriptional regulator [Kofleriaceae bacterium]|nr:AraC family transcriptional regulator [Kofleriaceae bacterium]